MNLPFSENLSVNKLASVFSSTSATYKFYWLIAIIELVEEGNIEINKLTVSKNVQSIQYNRILNCC